MSLLALDVVALDIETTGLNPAVDRLIELGVVRVRQDRCDPLLDVRVNPRVPIPKSATAIHGIDDAAVTDAPLFTDVWPRLSEAVGTDVVVGHSIGFDLAVLRHECERAGLLWPEWRILDVRLLAEVAEPNLPGHSIEQLVAWLNVTPGPRHSAAGDAATAGHIFTALLPRLRDKGIRTLAEAERACRALTPVLQQQHEAGWLDVATPQTATPMERTPDTYAYRHRVRDVMSAPRFASEKITVKAALTRMSEEGVSSLLVADEEKITPDRAGIITERDVMRALAKCGAAGLEMPIREFSSRPLASVRDDTFVYRARARMRRLKYRHLGVVDDQDRIVGVVTARDLLRLRTEAAISFDDEISEASDVATVARSWATLPQVAHGLLREGLSAHEISAVISHELGEVTVRAAKLAEVRLRQAGQGDPPCEYAVAVLGSAARDESLLGFDQDNALIFATDGVDERTERYFAALGTHIAGILHDVGVPYCKGGIMTSNPAWRGSVATWRGRIADWISRTTPEALMSVDIFYDIKCVHGEARLVSGLLQEAFDVARGNVGFAKNLADAAGKASPGLGLLGRFRTQEGRIDLKRTGLFGIVTFARALSICHHVLAHSTPGRLAALRDLKLGGDEDLEGLTRAHRTLSRLILQQQIEDLEAGLPVSNAVLVNKLSRPEKRDLREAFEIVQNLDQLTQDLLFRIKAAGG